MIWLGIRFYQFVSFYRNDGATRFVPRPEGIEGFLPISGLLGLSAWIKGLGFATIHPAALVIFLTIMAGSLLLRRSFCSWICPVATLSEYSWKTGFSLFRRNPRAVAWLDVLLRGMKYLLLTFFVYSILYAMSPDALHDFIQSDYHKTADVRLLDFFLNISPTALGICAILLVASILLRNPFCRYLCPYGALLGLVALLSPLRVTRDSDRCVSCGACNQVCPSYIDVMHKPSVASPECLGCWRCISHCRVHGALSMRLAGRVVVSGALFALLVLLLFRGGCALGAWSGYWHTSLTTSDYRQLLGK
jgi:polyferredoxin